MFVSWVIDQAGITEYKHAYTPTGAEMFRRQDRWFSSHPQPGDLVYYDFPPHERIEHVGIVVRENGDGSITTIEGNTSSGEEGS
jgi:cell wall-associated NlpC family hydrolase